MSALKSNMAAISMEINRGKKIIFDFFSIFYHTDHNKCTGRFHAVLYGTLDNIFYVFAHPNQEF